MKNIGKAPNKQTKHISTAKESIRKTKEKHARNIGKAYETHKNNI
jgi:hypothetical protein